MFKNIKEAAIIWLATQDKEINRIVLNKLLFFIDAVFYLESGKTITEDVYIKNPNGPVPKQAEDCRAFLLRNGLIKENWYNMGQYREYGYKVIKNNTDPKKVKAEFDDDELPIIKNVLDKLSSCSASDLSEITHRHEPWKSTYWEEELDLSKIKEDSDFSDWLASKDLIKSVQ